MLTNKDKLVKNCILGYVDTNYDLTDWLNYNIHTLHTDRIFLIDGNNFGEEISLTKYEQFKDKLTIIPFNSTNKYKNGYCYHWLYNYAYMYIKHLDFDYVLVENTNDYLYLNNLDLPNFITNELIVNHNNNALFTINIYDDNQCIYENNITNIFDNKKFIKSSYTSYIIKIEDNVELGLYEPKYTNEVIFNKLDSSIYYMCNYSYISLETYIKYYKDQNLYNNNIIINYFNYNDISEEKLLAILEFIQIYHITLSNDDNNFIIEKIHGFK